MAKIQITGIVVNESNNRVEQSPNGKELKLKDILVETKKFDPETGEPKPPIYYHVSTWDRDTSYIDKKVKLDAWVTSVPVSEDTVLTQIRTLRLEILN
jgi:hypothetical protein